MQSDKSIDVIIPVYNAEKTLSACIQSVINQTYRNLKIFLVDDGSRDGSLEICKRYASLDNRITVCPPPLEGQNGGVAAARNRGLNQLSGDYFAFVDSDDYLQPQAYEKMLGAALEHDLDLVFCKTYHVTGGTAKQAEVNVHKTNVLLQLKTSDACNDSMEGGIWSAFYRREFFGDLRFDERLRFGEDVLYFMDCFARKPRAMLLDEFLYNYGITVSFAKKYYCEDYLQQCRILGEECYDRLTKAAEPDCAEAEYFHEYYKAAFALASDKARLKSEADALKEFGRVANTKAGYRNYIKMTLKGRKSFYGMAKRFSVWLIHKRHFKLFRFIVKRLNRA